MTTNTLKIIDKATVSADEAKQIGLILEEAFNNTPIPLEILRFIRVCREGPLSIAALGPAQGKGRRSDPGQGILF